MKMKHILRRPKIAVKFALLQAANVDRIHIVGCSRSGTTMLAYALLAFNNTHLFDRETNAHAWPSMKETLEFLQMHVKNSEKQFYITKRNAGWWKPDHIQPTAKLIRKKGIFVINIVRDPRDVLSSKHPLAKNQFYVGRDLWLDSFLATEYLENSLEGYPRHITMRYEDVVQKHEEIEKELLEKVGLELSPGIAGMNRLKDCVEIKDVSGNMVKYMHKLRNFDANSIGTWRGDAHKTEHLHDLRNDREFSERLDQFMEKYNYGPFDLSSGNGHSAEKIKPLATA